MYFQVVDAIDCTSNGVEYIPDEITYAREAFFHKAAATVAGLGRECASHSLKRLLSCCSVVSMSCRKADFGATPLTSLLYSIPAF